jgi:hypothetical protein
MERGSGRSSGLCSQVGCEGQGDVGGPRMETAHEEMLTGLEEPFPRLGVWTRTTGSDGASAMGWGFSLL